MHNVQIVQSKLQRRHNPKVSPAAANRPEQILILRRARRNVIALRAHYVRGNHVVATQPMLAHQPANSAAQGQAAYTRRRDHTARGRQSARFASSIKLAPRCTALRDGPLPPPIHLHFTHPREVDH